MDRIRGWLDSANSVAALTGAGISAESSIPTFRGPGGLWRNYRPEDLATPGAFLRDPKLVWEWYDWRRGLIAKAEPNPGHAALATMANRVSDFTLITQNVDGLHGRAGSRDALKVHGDIWNLRCSICGAERQDLRPSIPNLPPRCDCGGLERPGVVWFGEALPPDVWLRAEEAARRAEVFLVIGTSAEFTRLRAWLAWRNRQGPRSWRSTSLKRLFRPWSTRHCADRPPKFSPV